ncbi:MAG: ACP S-malonyltransferase [Prochlorothrix sp.]|nr:ACP S-malonyltransferase [Prochlorothrix sp.]
MTTAWVFPGQGSQATGMGADLFDRSDCQAKVEEANSILGWSVADRCHSPIEDLSRTLYTQPCLYTVECLLVDLLRNQGTLPDYGAGHSLGEYVALYAAGVFDFATGLKLVQRRSQLMDQVSGGQMAALMGFDREALDGAIAATEGVVLANDNNPGQVVISGVPEAVEAILSQVKTKRAQTLKVSGAFHSPYMAEASSQFQTILAATPFAPAQFPILSNVDPDPTTDAETLKQRLSQQMTGSVRWRETSLKLAELGVTAVVEVGPGKVLTGLIKRTCDKMALHNVDQAPLPEAE